ncbi:ATP-dependent 6-phosphofructokinase [Porcipelethomonas sp.]|jgi:phosphofructokinase-like protein|uniref:6-phosphofructokinase n=1 Tax=Porcipelethomonas sp. TaxID=2981675 RepID=UPI0009635C1F|nr:6-phosphofructokinase [Ruminococcus sp.]MEE0186447.1 ATP-dependent 6-phosphofructokinase [Oscillospiraceae bacterium]OLA69311.1 MAG: 6-phosphofructokinase [Ruminococcus sp. 37_24]
MKKRIGILTSGGDCPGLNATIRGVAKACYEMMGEDNVEIVGIAEGYYGLINNICRDMKPEEFSGILTRGGTILGTKRQPFKMMQVIGDDNVDKVKNMKETYKKQKLDCLLTLGGNGTHKTSRLLSDEGLNVIGLPKTIDNDIYGTDVTFGFHTAVDIATDALDRLHTTANSHSRILLCEIMGNKAGWLTLNAGIAGGADIILIPEIPYDIDKVCESVLKRSESGKNFSIVAVAEGVFDQNEAQLKKKERARLRAEAGITTATNRIAAQIQSKTGLETRTCVPGHMLRGGSPSAYDRILATQFGVHAAKLISQEKYGRTVAKIGGKITANKLEDIAGKTKFVDPSDQLVKTAKNLGISFGD